MTHLPKKTNHKIKLKMNLTDSIIDLFIFYRYCDSPSSDNLDLN